MADRAKLDRSHGFFKSIVRNQVDRDNYDKEVKQDKANKIIKTPGNMNSSSKSKKKPDAAVYKPPVHREKGTGLEKDKKPIFIVEYEDDAHKIFDLPIFEDSDLKYECTIFSHKAGICEPLIEPLCCKIREEMNKYKKK